MKFYSCFIVVLTGVLYGMTSFSAFAAGYICSSKRYVTCAAGYFLNSSKCLKCPDNSTTVADNKSTTCTCKDGFSLNGMSTGVKTTTTAACKAFDAAAEAKAQEEAEREANTFSVAYSCGEGTGAAPNGGSILRGNNYTPATNTCTAPSGHSFAGWTVSGTNETKSAGSSFKWEWTENKTFTAKWSAGTYSITYHVNGGTNNGSNPATYKVTTSTITLGAPTRENSSFVGWYTDSGLTSSASQIVQGSTGDKTFYAKWSCNTGYSPNSDNTACVQGSVSEPEPQPEPELQPEPEPETEPVVEVELPKIEISKAEMTASGPNGLPCWYNSTPKAYKECVYNTVAGRLNS